MAITDRFHRPMCMPLHIKTLAEVTRQSELQLTLCLLRNAFIGSVIVYSRPKILY